MLNAIATVHGRNGFWNTNGGYELNLLIIAGAVALAATGGGRFSLDAFLGWEGELSGLLWAVAALVLGATGSAATLTLGRRRWAELDRLNEKARAHDRSRRAA